MQVADQYIEMLRNQINISTQNPNISPEMVLEAVLSNVEHITESERQIMIEALKENGEITNAVYNIIFKINNVDYRIVDSV